jgi:predicted metalloendopeptidase
MSWATIWRSKARDEATKKGKTDPHSPGMYLCTIAKCGYLYQAFGIQVNDGMYIAPEKS